MFPVSDLDVHKAISKVLAIYDYNPVPIFKLIKDVYDNIDKPHPMLCVKIVSVVYSSDRYMVIGRELSATVHKIMYV